MDNFMVRSPDKLSLQKHMVIQGEEGVTSNSLIPDYKASPIIMPPGPTPVRKYP